MEKFIHSNPGLESRFNKYLYFEDYNAAQLYDIFSSMCKKNGYTLSQEGETWVRRDLEELFANRDENFGNAGMCGICLKRRSPARPTGWPRWRAPPGSSSWNCCPRTWRTRKIPRNKGYKTLCRLLFILLVVR